MGLNQSLPFFIIIMRLSIKIIVRIIIKIGISYFSPFIKHMSVVWCLGRDLLAAEK